MYTTLVFVALFSLLSTRATYADTSPKFSVQTPMFIQCAVAQFSWDESTPPYNVIVVYSSDPCGQVVADLGDLNGTNISWTVDLSTGSSVMISVEDGEGEEAWSGAITIQPGNDTSCMNTATSSSTSPTPSHSAGNGSAGVHNSALTARHITVPTVFLGIIGLAFALVR